MAKTTFFADGEVAFVPLSISSLHGIVIKPLI